MASRIRLSTSEEFEIAIRWETVRSEYFRSVGNIRKSDESLLTIKELRLRLKSEGIDTNSDQANESDDHNLENISIATKLSETVFAWYISCHQSKTYKLEVDLAVPWFLDAAYLVRVNFDLKLSQIWLCKLGNRVNVTELANNARES